MGRVVTLPRGVGGAPGDMVSCVLRCGLSMSRHEVSLVRTHCHGAGGTPPETECAFHERLPAERLEREFQKQEGTRATLWSLTAKTPSGPCFLRNWRLGWQKRPEART